MNGEKKKILIGAAVIIAIWAIWGLVQKANAKKDDVKDASPKYYVTKVSIPTPCSQNPQLQTVKKRSFRLSWGSSRNQCFFRIDLLFCVSAVLSQKQLSAKRIFDQ